MSSALTTFLNQLQYSIKEEDVADDDSSSTHSCSAVSSKSLPISAFRVKIVPDNATSQVVVQAKEHHCIALQHERHHSSAPKISDSSESPTSVLSPWAERRTVSMDMPNRRRQHTGTKFGPSGRWGNEDKKLPYQRKSLVPPTRQVSADKESSRGMMARPSTKQVRNDVAALRQRDCFLTSCDEEYSSQQELQVMGTQAEFEVR